jgi:hypothetical protein
MKNTNNFIQQIETYVKAYVPPKKPSGFIPVVFTVPFEHSTDQKNVEMLGTVCELVEKINSKCVGRVVIGLDLKKSIPSIWVGVALLPIGLKDTDYLISDIPFRPIFESAG